MDLTAIDVFLNLAAQLHFGETAERMGLPQPSVSRIIRRLENEIGGALFERSSRRVRLTPLGTRLRDSLSKPYEDIRVAFDEAREAARGISGVLHIGALATTTGPPLTRLMKAFEQRFRTCRLLLSEVETLDPYRALRASEIDVMVTWLVIDEPDLVTGPVLKLHPRVVAVAVGHPLAKKSAVSIEEIANYTVPCVGPPFPPTLMNAFSPPVTPSGRSIRRGNVAKSVNEVVQQVALGRVVHLTVEGPALFQRRDIALIPIHDMPPLPLGLVWRRADENQRIRALANIAARSRTEV